MAQKITLIEYNDGTYAGDDMDPDIQHRDYVPCVSGTKIVPAEPPADIEETARRIEDMRNYAYVISSSSSFSSSSETPAEELFEHHETGGDDSYTIGQTDYSEKLAQTFTPDIAHEISKVALELFDNQGAGITGTITVEVKATDVNGKPTGAALASGTIDAADLEPAHDSDEYNSINKTVSSPSSTLNDVCFSNNGLHMYAVGYHADYSWNGIFHYTLSTAWDVTTASLNESLDLSALNICNPITGVFIKPDGTKLYIVGNRTSSSGTYIQRYDLSTPYYLTGYSAQIVKALFATTAQYGCWFNPAGTRLFTADNLNDAIFQYNLSIAWDETSLSSTPSQSTDVSGSTNACRGVAFNNDGDYMAVIDGQNHKVLFWNVPTAFNLSGESKDSYEMDISGLMTTPAGCYNKANGNTFWVCDAAASALTVYQFDLPAQRGDWHECELTGQAELSAATQYAIEATYDSYEADVSEPEWVNNSNSEDNYEAGTLLRYDGSNWYDS